MKRTPYMKTKIETITGKTIERRLYAFGGRKGYIKYNKKWYLTRNYNNSWYLMNEETPAWEV